MVTPIRPGKECRVTLSAFSALLTAMLSPNFSGAVSPVAIYILAICLVGAILAVAAFAWAVLRGEFADAAQSAFLVFDDEDEPRGPENTP